MGSDTERRFNAVIWLWLLIAFILGVNLGILIAALLAAGRDDG